MQKTYTCKYCNKQWETNEKRNGHQSRCYYNPKRKQTLQRVSNTLKCKYIKIVEPKGEYRIQCAKCGKQFHLELTEKLYLSGKYKKYCSRKCANSRNWNQKDKLKKSVANKGNQSVIQANNRPRSSKYQSKVQICPICKVEFQTKGIKRTYCSRICYKNDVNLQYRNNGSGGYRKGSGHGKSGWYKGIYCDSSWQLAYVMYHLDNNLPIQRNRQKRTYSWNGQQHIYIPDFITKQGLVQIKGYITQQWKQKQRYNPDVKVIDKEHIQQYLEYVKSKYGKNFIELYE